MQALFSKKKIIINGCITSYQSGRLFLKSISGVKI
jgi:hypothetical protein